MKYCRFLVNDEIKYGMVDVNRIIELVGPFIGNVVVPTDSVYKLEEVTLLSPVEPKQMVAIGLNYFDHAKEQKKMLPQEPMMFMVSPSAVIGPNDTIELNNDSHRIEHEVELVIVMGKEAKHVPKDEALNYVFGYTIANDVSDRDFQKLDGQNTRAKSFHTYKPIGPVIETRLNPNKLDISLKVNGEIRQNGKTSDMIHSVEKIIETVTGVMTLYPGDVILTGTPSGVGKLASGDKLELSIEGIGTLVNHVSSKQKALNSGS